MMEALLALHAHLTCTASVLCCDWQLLAGQAMQESSGDPAAIGDDGKAYGLWQIHEATLENCRRMEPEMDDWELEDLLDAEKNWRVYMTEMCRLRVWLLNDYGDAPIWVLLASWNWGCGNVKKLLDAHKDDWMGAYWDLPERVKDYVRLCYFRSVAFRSDECTDN